MNATKSLLAALALAAAVAAAQTPAVAADQPKAAAGKAKTVDVQLLNYKAPVPAAWVQQPPANNMRLAQYLVPGESNAGDGEVIVFYFGQGQGGSVEANTERWASQFTSADGKPVKPAVKKLKTNGIPVTVIELNGTYARGIGMGTAGNMSRPDQTLLAAVFETPRGNVTVHLYGPRATVAANRKAFDQMVRGFRSA